jgi:hypothetical protein
MAGGANPGWLETLESLDEFRVGPPSEGLRNVLRREDDLRHEENQADGDSVADDDEGEAFELRAQSYFEKLLPYLHAFEGNDERRMKTLAVRDAFAAMSRALVRWRNVERAHVSEVFSRTLKIHADNALKRVWELVECDRAVQDMSWFDENPNYEHRTSLPAPNARHGPNVPKFNR